MLFERLYKVISRKIISVGVLATAKLIINRCIDKIFHRETVLFYIDIPSYSINPTDINMDAIGRKFECFEELSSKDMASLKDYAGGNYAGVYKRRFANNWKLFLVYSKGQLAGGCWAATNTSDLKTKIVPLQDGDVALIDGWTIPTFRGKNIYSFILSFIVTQYKEKDFKRAFGYGAMWNTSAVKGIRKAGFQESVIFESYNIFGNEVVIWKSSSKGKA